MGTLINIFKVEDLRRRILFTLMMLVVFRIGSFIPVPNTNAAALQSMFQKAEGFFGLLNTFSGGAIANFSVFTMGIMPYITASIIVQLLTMDVVPIFTRWAKEGEVGRRKLAQVTRYATIVLAIFNSIGLSVAFSRQPQFIQGEGFWTYALIAVTLTAGTAFLMWLGEQITDKGIGNGISILIFGGIVAAIPHQTVRIFTTLFEKKDQIFLSSLVLTGILLAVIVVIVGVIYMQQGVRKIPVQYTKRVVGRKMYGGQSTHIPMKVNAAGVIPVIFAVSLMMFPSMVAQFWAGHPIADWFIRNMNYTSSSIGMAFYVLLIVGFTYFYTFVQINPIQLADQMKKNGGFVPGIRPGKATASFLTKVMNRLTLTGALFLAAVSILPVFFISLAGVPQSVTIGGTSLLIVVGVALETMKTVESQLIKRHYKGFMNK